MTGRSFRDRIAWAPDAPAGGAMPAASANGGGGDPAAPEGAAAATWRDTLPEDLRGHEVLGRLDSVEALAREHVNAQGLIGRKGLILPQSAEDKAGWDKVWAELGRPESPEKYDLGDWTPPEGLPWNGDAQQAMLAKAHARGVPNDMMKGLIADYAELQKASFDQLIGNANAVYGKAVDSLKGEWGDQYDAQMARANRAVREFFGDQAEHALKLQLLDGSFLLDNAQMARAFAAIGAALGGDDDLPTQEGAGGGGGPDVSTPEGAKAEIVRLMKDADFQAVYRNPADPKYKDVAERWHQLHRTAFPGRPRA